MASTRRQCREALGVAFASQGFGRVYIYAPLDLKGETKVLVITSDNTRHEVLGAGFANNFYRFFLDVYVLRRGDIDTESFLDDMHEIIRAVARAGVGNPVWNEITLEEESEALYVEVSGAPYRLERHFLLLKVSSD
jgi:hypothetical protein